MHGHFKRQGVRRVSNRRRPGHGNDGGAHPRHGGGGADIIEIGIPFSDPIAEGPVIQAASARALAAGCTVDRLFEMAARLRGTVTVPLLFMTYANPIFAYGAERFMERCRACGIDGIIVPDVPFEERGEFRAACRTYGIAQISLLAPTSEARAAEIARESEGFLYCVRPSASPACAPNCATTSRTSSASRAA